MRLPKPKLAVVDPERIERVHGARVGHVVGFDGSEVRVDFGAGSLTVRASATLDDATLSRAARDGQQAVLVFEEGDVRRPVIIALLRSRSPLVDALLSEPLPETQKEARVDGKRVLIEGKEEIVLRCGKASLTLYKDGHIELRGVNVVSQADRVQKIRGGKVQVN